MKLLLPCIIFSLLLHGLLFLIFSRLWLSQPVRELVIDFRTAAVTPVEAEISPLQPVKVTAPGKFTISNVFPANRINLNEYKTTLALPESARQDTLPHITHEELFIVDTVYLARPDYSKLALMEYRDGSVTYRPGYDRPDGGVQNYNNVQDQIIRQSSGHPQQTVGVLGLLQQGAKELGKALGVTKEPGPVHLDFIPEAKELQALNVIWQNRQATDVMIYASFDTCLKVTAEDLRKILDGLVEKGLLEKKIVSPRDEFTFFGLTGDSGIEMNKTNRRNRVYEYTPLLGKEEMRDYLNAVLYQQKLAAQDSTGKGQEPVFPDIQSLLDILYKDNE
ncbi:MAG TPA: hypothetical protein PLP19_12350 [bacterium]|nr:hypothetical protein [bacterium]HPN44275.1 hypothetical protein [bacterium]